MRLTVELERTPNDELELQPFLDEESAAPVTPWKAVFPVPMLAVLMAIGLVDLIVTAVLHAYGLIVELNPIMKPLIESSEWLFAFVKGLSLVGAWYVMWKHAKINAQFVNRAAMVGSAVYVAIWCGWFFGAS